MRIVFMGTPDFAVPTLEAVAAAGHEVVLAVTQPDKAKGRSGQLSAPPVKEAAQRLGIPVFQPRRVREPDAVRTIRDCSPDVIVVVAFGQILPQELLDVPRLGCINGHASLLPKLRGAAPIQWAVIEGEAETGITTMYMDAGLDTGDMILQEKVPIAPDETGGSLHDKLAGIGARLMVETLRRVEEGTAPRIPQEGESTYAKMLKKEMGDLDFTRPAAELERLVRGLSPWPGTFARLNGKILKIWRAAVSEISVPGAAPGEITGAGDGVIRVQTGDGSLELLEVQLEGKKRMDTASFLRGVRIREGDSLCR